jgi:glycerol transport system ATP-binding protein
MVAQLTGVHYFELGTHVTAYFHPRQLYVFDASGMLLLSPGREGVR